VNAYEEKRAARAVRLRERAVKLDAEGTSLWRKDDKLLACMNGTPVLRGHSSEKRHRRDLDRIDSHRRKAIELKDEAASCARRADAAESNDTISSDDPEAIEKLRAKAAEIERSQDLAKAINKAIGRRVEPAAIRLAIEAARDAGKLSVSPGMIAKLCLPDELGNHGIPAYKLRNWASEARRIRGRIAELETKAAAPPRADEAFGGDIVITEADNRVRVLFATKPAPAVIALLKSRGFRWSPTASAWQRQATENGWYAAREVARFAQQQTETKGEQS